MCLKNKKKGGCSHHGQFMTKYSEGACSHVCSICPMRNTVMVHDVHGQYLQTLSIMIHIFTTSSPVDIDISIYKPYYPFLSS